MVNSSDEVSKKLTAIESKLNTIKENSSNKIELSVVIKKDSFRTGNGTGQFFKISPMNAKSSPLRSTVESINKNDVIENGKLCVCDQERMDSIMSNLKKTNWKILLVLTFIGLLLYLLICKIS